VLDQEQQVKETELAIDLAKSLADGQGDANQVHSIQ
jgi:hypothetical protein